MGNKERGNIQHRLASRAGIQRSTLNFEHRPKGSVPHFDTFFPSTASGIISCAAVCRSRPGPISQQPDAEVPRHCARLARCGDAPPTTFAIGRRTGPRHNPPRRPVGLWSARLLRGWGSFSQVQSTARSMGVQISGNTNLCPAMNVRSLFCKCGLARCRQFQVNR